MVPSDFIDAFPASTMTQDEIFVGVSSAEFSAELLPRRYVVIGALSYSRARLNVWLCLSYAENSAKQDLAAGRCCITIGVMAADAFIHCRVTSEQKALVRRLAEREGINESTLVKQLLELVFGLRRSRACRQRRHRTKSIAMRGCRFGSRQRIGSCSRNEPLHGGWLRQPTPLVRSHLRDIAPLPKTEYLALKESIMELAAIGRNLNQIARALHQGGRPALPARAEVVLMLKIAVTVGINLRRR